jgi:hypothetical protein
MNRGAFIAAVFGGDVETARRLKDEAVRELYSQPDFNPVVRAHLAKCLEKAEAKVGRRPVLAELVRMGVNWQTRVNPAVHP